MVEKAQIPSGFIHWTVAVIPLGCVIILLLGCIVFLLWRLKWATRKQTSEMIVSTVPYEVQTKSILNSDGKKKNNRALKQNRVHFQKTSVDGFPEYHDLPEVATSSTGCAEYVALSKNKRKADRLISRHLGIRRKHSKELQSKYPLDNPSKDVTSETEFVEMSDNTSHTDEDLNTSLDCLQPNDCARTNPGASDCGNGENSAVIDCPDDSLC